MYSYYLPIYDKKKCLFFALGRNAIYAACKLLGLKAGDEVLTPAFDCDAALQPFKVLGLKLVFYRSNPYTFAVDIEDIKKHITSKTKLIHVINHFGLPQQWGEILQLRKSFDIPILEDNAYSLFSKMNNRLFGTFGDVAIFSLRKNIPLLHGGLLRVNNPRYVLKFRSKNLYWRFWCPELSRAIFKRNKPGIPEPPPLYSDSDKGYPYWFSRDAISKEFSCDYLRPISLLARIQLNRLNKDDHVVMSNKKVEYYKMIVDRLKNIKGIEILWPVLPEGIVPFCLSFLISSNRDDFLKILRHRYSVMAWPTLSKLVLEQLGNFPEVRLLGRRLLQLNLPADKIRMQFFPREAEGFIRDVHDLSRQYLAN